MVCRVQYHYIYCRAGDRLHILAQNRLDLYYHVDLSPILIMPRIPFSVILRAHRENNLLSMLLKECRTIDSARNELRWLRERAVRDSQSLPSKTGWRSRLRSMCQLRSKGYPLQYILGDQPFGELEILCRKGVLIPRFVHRNFQQGYITNTFQARD